MNVENTFRATRFETKGTKQNHKTAKNRLFREVASLLSPPLRVGK
jgi:hypothetical protein